MNSKLRATKTILESSPAARRIAADLAKTAIHASAPVVTAVPRAMAKVAATPAAKSPCASAKTKTRIAPEHGRAPAAMTVRGAVAPRDFAAQSGWIGRVSVPAGVPSAAVRRCGSEEERGRRSSRGAPSGVGVGRRRGQRPASLETPPHGRDERFAFAPVEPQSDCRHAAIARQRHEVGCPVHFGGGGAKRSPKAPTRTIAAKACKRAASSAIVAPRLKERPLATM